MHILIVFSIVNSSRSIRVKIKKSRTTSVVTLTMSHSAARLSLLRWQYDLNEGQQEILRPVAFRLPITRDLALPR